MRAQELVAVVAAVLATLTVLVCDASSDDDSQTFATMPSHQTAVLGSTAVLPCRVLNFHGLVQWTRDGFGLGTTRDLDGFDRYSMIGSDEEGDFSLRITPVTLEDDAVYQCQVSSSTEMPLRSQVARLTVFVPPQPPRINHAPVATAGVPYSLTCSSTGGRPEPEVQWLDDKGSVVHKNVQHQRHTMENGLTMHVNATLTFTPTRHHHTRVLTCLTHNPALHSALSAKVRLNVEFPPEVQLVFTPEELQEGQEASVRCQVEANPIEVTYRWFRGGEEVPGAVGDTMPLGVLARGDHATPLACEVTNAVGTTRKTVNLNIKYPPRFVSAPNSESEEPGKGVSLKCRVDANPAPEVTWTRPNHPKQVVGTGEELYVQASRESDGEYVCTAVSEGFEPLQGRLHLRLRGPPEIKAQASVAVRVGQKAVLRCGVVAVPHPVSVTWGKQGVALVPGERWHVEEEQRADGVVSTLTINSTSLEDFSGYNCTAINEYGVDTHQILLQKQPMVPLMMIVGGGAGVVVVVILVSLFILCGKHQSSRSSKDKAAEAEKGVGMGVVMSQGVNGKGRGGGDVDDGGVMSVGNNLKMMPTLLSTQDNRSTGQESDNKDVGARTPSSLSGGERESDSGWERDSTKGSGCTRDLQGQGVSHHYVTSPAVFTPPDQGYMSYVDYARDYSPVPVSGGEGYAQFTVGGPYARSTPASDQPSSLPSSVAPPPYTPPPSHPPPTDTDVPNGRLHHPHPLHHTNGKMNAATTTAVTAVNGGSGGGLNGSLKHTLLQDLKNELAREMNHDLDSTTLTSKYIIPPQTKIKPGTLV